MFEKNMKYSYLLDVYGSLLDDHSAAIMRAYYEDDLSLSEIAEGEGISRQGVRHILKKGEEELFFLEERLGLAAHHRALAEGAEALCEMARALVDSEAPQVRALAEAALHFSAKCTEI